jgi:nicotinamide-nucleotide amidase
MALTLAELSYSTYHFDFGYNLRMNQGSIPLVTRLANVALQKQLKVCTAESCTGGLIAKSFTDLAGSSDWFERGFVTYSNQSKSEMVDVPESVIIEYGAVSEPVANAMARGALKNSAADVSIAVTGVAGPAGGSKEKPVGTVWIVVASEKQLIAKKYLFDGDREAIRIATMLTAIEMLLQLLDSSD